MLNKKIIFTSFDSGAWSIPSFDVTINGNNFSKKFSTDSLLVNVGYSPADSTGQLRDIKPVMEVTVTDYTWIYISAIVLGLGIIAFLLYWYFKKRKKKSPPVFHSSLSAYEEAMAALAEMDQFGLEKPADTKQYYTRLSEIFKRYYSRKQQQDLINKTTGDLLIMAKDQEENAVTISQLAEALRCADAVKFAKYLPGAAESKKSLGQIKEVIGTIEKNQSSKKL